MSFDEPGSDRRENRLVLVIGILVALAFAQAIGQAVTARVVFDQRQLLNKRTPIITAIEQADIHTRCMNQLTARFLAMAAETIVAEDAERERLLPEMMLVVEKVREAAQPGANPCEVSSAATAPPR